MRAKAHIKYEGREPPHALPDWGGGKKDGEAEGADLEEHPIQNQHYFKHEVI